MRMNRHPYPRLRRRPNRLRGAVAALALMASGFAAAMPAFEAVPVPAAKPASAPAAGCLPKVEGAWIRMPPAGLPMMAGYARISNPCKAPLAIVAAHSDAFADTSLHETRVEGGISRMRATPSLRLAPGSSATLAPGGFHLMLMRPVKPLHAGDRVMIEFTLEDGRRFSAPFDARPIAGP
jgi:copper(I)-binding protein